jgi:hypothetical protein
VQTASQATRRVTILTLLAIVLVALVVRGWAVLRLPVDFDEPIYLQAGLDYAEAFRAGDWAAVIDYEGTREHPALVKVLYGVTVSTLGEDPDRNLALYAARSVSAVFGMVAVLIVALVNPLAGALLAVHTLVVKYTSQVYLEALPLLASTIAVLATTRVQAGRDRWFWLSAAMLGVTAAAKFTYVPVVLVVVVYLALTTPAARPRLWWRDLIPYSVVALAVFWALNPTLWHDPLGRLWDALTFHVRYSQGAHVQEVGYPWYQSLYWITRAPPSTWHPEVFIYPGLDGLITVAAAAGLVREWRRRRWLAVWILAGLAFLLIWPTKWPQYTLVLAPPLCLAAASTVEVGRRWLQERLSDWGWLQALFPKPPLAFWVLLAALVLIVGILYSVITIEQALGRLGWTHITTDNTLLPSNTVYDVVPGPDGVIALATERGLALWDPPSSTGRPERWRVYTLENSALPDNRIVALAYDPQDALWVGTETGLARFDGETWTAFSADDAGLAGTHVYDLAAGDDGRVWVATGDGAAVYDGDTWTPLPLIGRTLAVAVAGDVIWFGTADGISRLASESDTWIHMTAAELGLAGGGVSELLLDSAGRLWAGTLGDGLGLWDGASWRSYRTSNSDIPFNLVQAIAEVEPGCFWIGTALPAEAGGRLSEFDGDTWTELSARNSGFSGAEPLAITLDHAGRRWIATRAAGLDVYEPDRSD